MFITADSRYNRYSSRQLGMYTKIGKPFKVDPTHPPTNRLRCLFRLSAISYTRIHNTHYFGDSHRAIINMFNVTLAPHRLVPTRQSKAFVSVMYFYLYRFYPTAIAVSDARSECRTLFVAQRPLMHYVTRPQSATEPLPIEQ